MTTGQRSTDPIGAGDDAPPDRCARGTQAGRRRAEGKPEARRVTAGTAGGVSRRGSSTFSDRKTAKQVRERGRWTEQGTEEGVRVHWSVTTTKARRPRPPNRTGHVRERAGGEGWAPQVLADTNHTRSYTYSPRAFGCESLQQIQLVIKSCGGELFSMGLSPKLGAPIQSGRSSPIQNLTESAHFVGLGEIFDEFRNSRPGPHFGAVSPRI
jgi:hypothetical protein